MKLPIAVICAAMCWGGVANAQERKATPQEKATIEACFTSKLDSPEGIEGCLFKVAEPCADAAGGSTFATSDCYRVEQTIWDGLLNAAHRELIGELDAQQKKALQKMQRAWIASRDATCNFYADKIRGSLAATMSAACFTRETARRALLMKQFTGL